MMWTGMGWSFIIISLARSIFFGFPVDMAACGFLFFLEIFMLLGRKGSIPHHNCAADRIIAYKDAENFPRRWVT